MTTAIVLAGGLGTRLRSELPDIPKCLAPVGSRTFLEILLKSLSQRGFDDFVLALSYKADTIQTVAKKFELQNKIRCVVEVQPLGTGGAIFNAMSEMKLNEAVVINGDTYFNGHLSGLLPPLNAGELCRMAVTEVSDKSRYGGIQMESDADKGNILGFIEKGDSGPGWINAGYYRLHVDCFAGFPKDKKFSFEEDIMPQLVAKQNLSYVKLHGNVIDIGIPADYRRFCESWGKSLSASA